MKKCVRHSQTNDKPSELYETLYSNIANGNELEADLLYSYFKSPQFINIFGDYVEAFNDGKPLDNTDENGEPLLQLDEESEEYYFISRYGDRIKYPLNNNGLITTMSSADIVVAVENISKEFFASLGNDVSVDQLNLESDTSLDKFIEDLLNKKKGEARASKNRLAYVNFNTLLNHIPELKTRVSKHFDKLGLSLVDNETEDATLIGNDGENEARDYSFNTSSFEKSSLNNISKEIKLRLSFIENTNLPTNYWGAHPLLGMGVAYNTISENLANTPNIDENFQTVDVFNLQLERLRTLAEQNPAYESLYLEMLQLQDKADSKFRNDFATTFNKATNNFTRVFVTLDSKKGTSVNYVNMSKTGGATKAELNTMTYDLYSKFTDKTVNKPFEDSGVRLTEIADKLSELKQTFVSSDKGYLWLRRDFIKILNDLGVTANDTEIEHVVSKSGSIVDIDGRAAEINKMIIDLSGMVNAMKSNFENNIDNRILLNSISTLHDIAKAKAFFKGESSEVSIRVGQKNRYVMSNPSFIQQHVNNLKSVPGYAEYKLNQNAYTKGSYYLQYYTANEARSSRRISSGARKRVSEQRLSKLDVQVFTAAVIKEGFKSAESLDGSEMRMQDYLISQINATFDPEGAMKTSTPADKSTDRQIVTGIPRFENILSSKNDKLEIDNNVLYIFRNYFMSEFMRMREAAKEIKNAAESIRLADDKEAAYNEAIKALTVHYHFNERKGLPFDKKGNILFKNLGNAFKSQLFPALSYDSERDQRDGSLISRIQYILYGNAEMTQDNFMFNEFTSINESFNNPDFYNATDYDGNKLDALLGEYINNVLINRILKLNDTLIKEDIIVKNVEDGTIDTKRTKIDKKLLDAKLSKYTDAIMVHPSQFDLALTTDYLVNNMIHLIEYSKMFAGDFAYYKNMDDYHKRVPATYTDGTLPNFGDANPTFNVAVASTINIKSSVHKQLVEMLGEEGARPYENINAADAQAWITPQRWKVLMQSKWTPVHESVYKKMLSKKPETFTHEELLAAAQPLKGVYFEINNGVPMYMKYSQAVLSPHLVNNNPGLEGLLKSMEEQGVDELVTSDAFKVGSPVSTVVHNPNGSFKDNLLFNVKTISSTGWKLQQDLPTKTFKELNIGSQIQKNIFAGLLFNEDVKDFKLDSEDKTITGKEVINRIVKATKFLSDHGYESVLREFGIDENGKITNRTRYFEAITEELREAGHEFAAKALERGLSPYAIPSIGTKMDQMFASILTKRIVKIQTNGASLIQMSNVGFSKHEGDGVMWAPDLADSTVPYEPHFVKDKNNHTILGDNGKPLIKPAGVLISGSFLAKYIPNYEEYNTPEGLKKLFGYTDKDGNFVRGMIDKDILNKVIGYRIPNQGLASNDAMEIIGILPATQGDTIVAYTGVTTKTGSDFDIDKMFIMMPSFRYDTYIPRKDAKTVFDNIIGREGKNRKTFLQDVEFFLNEYNVELENSSFLYSDDKYTSEEADELWSEMTIALIRLAKNPKNTKIAKAFDDIGVDVKKITNLRYIKPVGEMTKAKAQNLLIESYKATLLSNSNIEDVMRPIDDDTIKNEMVRNKNADDNEYSQPGSDLYHVDPYHDIELMYSFRKGKLGVGQEANQMVDVNRAGKLVLNGINLGRGHHSDSEKGMLLDQQFSEELSADELAVFFKEAKEYHKLFGDVKMFSVDDILKKTNNFDSDYIRENFSKELADKVESIRKMSVATVYTSLLNGFVDIAKEPFITDANWVAATTNPGNFLVRAGVHPIWVVNFIGQPVIKKYIDFMSSSTEYGEIYNNFMKSLIEDNVKGDKSVEFKHNDPSRGTVTTTVTVKNILDKIMLSSKQDSEIIRSLLDNNDLLLGEVINDNSTRNRLLNDATFMSDFSKMVDNIKEIYQKSLSASSVTELPSLVDLKNNSKNSTIDTDLQIISFFREIQGYSRNLNNIMKILKVDTDGLDGSLSNISAMKESVDMILANENEAGAIKGLYSKLNNTITGVYFENVTRLNHIVSNNNDLFPHLSDNVQEVFKEISKGIDGTALTDMELAKQIERSFQVYTLDKFFGINTSQQVYDLLAKFPQEFEDFKNRLKEEDRLSEYPILEDLFLESSTRIYANPKSGENVLIFNNASGRTPFRISATSNKKSESETLDMIASWSRLYAEDKEFASKLIEYAYLVSGFEVGPREFFQYMPQEYFIDNKFNDDLAVSLSDPSSFGNMFFENNSDNYKVVRNVPRFNNVLNTGFKATSYGGVLHVDEHDKIVRPYLNYNEKSGDVVNEKLLKFVGLDHQGNRVYVNVPKRGLRSRDLNFKLVNYSDNTVNPSERIFRTRNEEAYYANKDMYAAARTTGLQAVSTLPEASIFNDEDSSLHASREGVTAKNKQVKDNKAYEALGFTEKTDFRKEKDVSYQDIKSKYNFESIDSILESISNNTKNPHFKRLADAFIKIKELKEVKLSENNNIPVNGRYYLDTNSIDINVVRNIERSNIKGYDAEFMLEQTILHEIVHALTKKATSSSERNEFISNIENLAFKIYNKEINDSKSDFKKYLEIQREIKSNRENVSEEDYEFVADRQFKFYGLTNLDEFLTMSMTNPVFRNKLKETTLWQELKHLIAKFLGIAKTDLDFLESNFDSFLESTYGVNLEAPLTPQQSQQSNSTVEEGVSNPAEFTNHSGGAYGGDTFWDLVGREFGVTNHKHYKDAGNANLSQQLRNKGVKAEILTKEQMDFARQKVKELLGIEYKDDLRGNLQVRNFYQVYNADAVYAVANINPDNKSVSGGTNTAIQLGIKLKKPVYVWDINSETWNKFEPNLEDSLTREVVSEFYEIDTPTLTKNFAGVGSRDIENYNVQKDGKWQPREEYVGSEKEEKAKQAIRDVYANTFGKLKTEINTQQVTDLKGNVYNVANDDIITYTTEVGDIQYITNKDGDLVMLKDSQVNTQESETPKLARKFKPLNVEQKTAISRIDKFLYEDTSSIFLLDGKAGTGKTTILASAISEYLDNNPGSNVYASALAHTAKGNLVDKLTAFIDDSKVIGTSIAGLLGVKYDLVEGRFKQEFNDDGQPKGLLYESFQISKDVLIVDELSMVNSDFIQQILDAGAKVILVGDIGQLGPINDTLELGFKRFDDKATLRERVRQGEGNPVLEYADKFWTDENTSRDKLLPNTSFEDSANRHGNLINTDSLISISDSILPLFQKMVETGDTKIAKVITYHNKTRDRYNDIIRKKLFKSKSKTPFIDGDIVMFQSYYSPALTSDALAKLREANIQPEQLVVTFENAHEIQLENVKSKVTKGFKSFSTIYPVTIEEGGKEISVDFEITILHPSEKDRYHNKIKELRALIRNNRGSEAAVKYIEELKSLVSTFASVEYSYAITTHKSQGATYEAVIYDLQDTLANTKSSNIDKHRAIYTGMTRAKYSTIVISGKPANKAHVDYSVDFALNDGDVPIVQTDLAKAKHQALTNNSKRFELSERTVKADEGGEVNVKESVYLNTKTDVPYSRVTKMLSTNRNYTMEDFSFLDINNAFNVSPKGVVTIDDNVFDAMQTQSNNSSELTDPTTVHRHKRINQEYATMLRLKSATVVGNKLDDIVRDFFSGKSIEATLNSLSTSEDVRGQIRQALDVLQTYFRNRGETVYTEDIMFYNDTFGVAGTPDIVTVDKHGVYRIYDLKTNKDIFTFDKQYKELDVEGDVVTTIDPETNEEVSVLQPAKLDKYNKQLNTYRVLMNNTHGIAAAELKLIVFDMTYDGTNGRTDVVNVKFSEDQIIDIPVLDEVIPFGMEDAVKEAKSENLYDGLSISEKFNQFGVMTFDAGVTLDLSKTLDEGQEGSPGKMSMRKTMMAFAEQLESKYGADWQSRFKEGLQYYKASNNLESISGSEFIDFLKKCSK